MLFGAPKYCGDKKCYDKRGAITVANKRYREGHVRLRIYACEDCGHWHLTKQLRGKEYMNKERRHKKTLHTRKGMALPADL